jgi:uncharacterized membrane protein YGL010W
MRTIALPSYVFYQQYHRNRVNKIIHIFCIPMISWSMCVLIPPDQALLLTLFYVGIYGYLFTTHLSNLGTKTFLMLTGYLLAIWASAVAFRVIVVASDAIAWSVFVFSWIMQFVGHWAFEGNRPALLDSLHQSFLMAPMFSYFELEDLLSE